MGFNPIVERRDISFSLVPDAIQVNLHVAVVAVKGNGGMQVFPPSAPPRRRDLSWGGFRTLYMVYVGDINDVFECELPSSGDTFRFKCRVAASYAVSDPAVVVRRNIYDAESVMRPLLVQLMRPVTRQFSTLQSGVAEDALNETLTGRTFADVGMRVSRVSVAVHQDEEARVAARGKELYRGIIDAGRVDLLAVQLAHNPGDLSAVTDMLMRQEHAQLEFQVSALETFINSDALEAFQLEDAAKGLLRQFVQTVRGRMAPPKALDAVMDLRESPVAGPTQDG